MTRTRRLKDYAQLALYAPFYLAANLTIRALTPKEHHHD